MKVFVGLSLSLTFLAASPSLAAFCTAGEFVSVPPDADGIYQVVTEGFSYSPRCLKVSKGSRVSIPGSFIHPTIGVQGEIPNPISANRTRSPQVVQFTEAGTFNYYCGHHGTSSGGGMSASVLVE